MTHPFDPNALNLAQISWRFTALAAALSAHWLYLACFASLALLSLRVHRRALLDRAEVSRERRIRRELQAYSALDPSLARDAKAGLDPAEAARALAKRVCSAVAAKSVFTRVTMLLRDPEGRFVCTGSVGTDDLTLAALHAWGERVAADERQGKTFAQTCAGSAPRSFPITLGEWQRFDPEIASWALTGRRERRRWRRGMVAPICTPAGRMLGAIAICADGARLDGVRNGDSHVAWGAGVARAMAPIESLAARLAIAMDNEALAESLLRAEKLAGLGQLAGGVAHALNNPLTAVLGFADLIAESTSEPRIRKDAETIVLEATKMKRTVERLSEFWRPSTLADQPFDLTAMLDELATSCRPKLHSRGVELELAGVDHTVPALRGSPDRLRQVLEQLLNNAAQAIAALPEDLARKAGPHAIRIHLTHDERSVNLVVSDTGPGFLDPGRVFDPFYTTKGPEQGAGLGLSICYGIVREHGGEISAVNLHPHGAAVLLELPLRPLLEAKMLLISDAYSATDPAARRIPYRVADSDSVSEEEPLQPSSAPW